MNFRNLVFIILTVLFSLKAFAQHTHEDHEHDDHHSNFEIGVSNGYVYNFTEKEGAYGLHLHLLKTVGESHKIALGLGYEAIFDDHKHNAISAILEYRFTEHFLVNFAPGVAWLATQANSIKPSIHLEGIYAFELGIFHIGPMIGVASNFEDYHASLGLHIAIGL